MLLKVALNTSQWNKPKMCCFYCVVYRMKRKFNQWSFTIPPTKTTPLITSHYIERTNTYGVANPGPGLGQVHQCGGLDKLVNEISNANKDIRNTDSLPLKKITYYHKKECHHEHAVIFSSFYMYFNIMLIYGGKIKVFFVTYIDI
jgi:hypothetical protein